MNDKLIEQLKRHFAAFFTFKNWMYEKDANGRRKLPLWRYTLNRPKLFVWGLCFITHDWAINWTAVTWKFNEKPQSMFELVTTRLKRYKKLLPRKTKLQDLPEKDQARYLWAVEQCDFCNEYDEDHC